MIEDPTKTECQTESCQPQSKHIGDKAENTNIKPKYLIVSFKPRA